AGGLVWASASEDYDGLLFGAPRLVRGLAARSRDSGAAAQVIDRAEFLEQLGIDGEELILMGILIGTDYNDGAPGYGPKRALKLVREHRGWAATVQAAGLDPAEAQSVAELFRHPEVVPAAAPVFGPVDPERVRELLVLRHGFSADRVELALERAERGISRRGRKVVPVPPAGHQSRLELFEESPP
ncbi:MAG: PIN domain-containing protein, partial [Thermoplasmata archaeon]